MARGDMRSPLDCAPRRSEGVGGVQVNSALSGALRSMSWQVLSLFTSVTRQDVCPLDAFLSLLYVQCVFTLSSVTGMTTRAASLWPILSVFCRQVP